MSYRTTISYYDVLYTFTQSLFLLSRIEVLKTSLKLSVLQMNEQIQLLTDRLEDIESHVINLQTDIDKTLATNSPKTKSSKPIIYLLLPLAVTAMFLMGLKIDYTNNGYSFSYNSDVFIEIGLGAITLLTSVYTLKIKDDE